MLWETPTKIRKASVGRPAGGQVSIGRKDNGESKHLEAIDHKPVGKNTEHGKQ